MHKQIRFFIVLSFFLLVSCSVQFPFRQEGTPEITPSRTSTLASSTPIGEPQRFSPASANGIGPEDILKEVSLFPGAGGGGGQFCDFTDSTHSTIDQNALLHKEIEWLDTVVIPTCGWQPNELVRMTVHFPDGRSVTRSYRATDAFSLTSKGEIRFGIEFVHKIEVNDPLGSYEFLMEGESEKLQYSINVVKPTPHIRDMTPIDVSQHGNFYPKTLFLYGFYPNEKVRLFLYASFHSENTLQLIAWQQLTMDSNGQRFVNSEFMVPEGQSQYGAVGETSGASSNLSILARGQSTPTSIVSRATPTPDSMHQTITRAKTRCDRTWFFTPPATECILFIRSAPATTQVFKGGQVIGFEDTRQVFVFYNPPGNPQFPFSRLHSWDAFQGDLSSLFSLNPQLKFQLGEPTGKPRQYTACMGIGVGDNPFYEQVGYVRDADNKVLKFSIERNLRQTDWLYMNARVIGCSEKQLLQGTTTPPKTLGSPNASRTPLR